MYSYEQKVYSCQTDETLELHGYVTQDCEVKQNGLRNSACLLLGLNMSDIGRVSHICLPVTEP